MNVRRLVLTALLAGTTSAAFGGYTISRIDGGSNTLVQGREYAYQIVSSPALFDNVDLRATGPLADYQIIVGAGIQVGPNEYKVDSSGRLNFIIRYHRAPGSVPLTVTNRNDSAVTTTITNTIQRYPVTFQISPNNPTITAGVPFAIQITAVDATGNFVSAFEDAVQITDSQLNEITPVAGTSFSNGVANANVTVKAGDMNNKTRLTVGLVGIQYFDPALPAPHLVSPASFTTPELNLNPGPFEKVAMLFPGEVLTPGIGKSGTVITQVANIPVSEVTVWRVDSFYNPIRASVPTTISFNSSNGSDVNPADRNMNVPPLSVLGGAVDPFKFISNGTRTIRATPDGDVTRADTSIVPVAPGASNTYEFSVQPGDSYTTDDVITVEITARDSANQVLTTLYGPLPGARLMARTLTTPVEEKAEWVDTNPATNRPDNVVTFSAGVATINLSVTKRAAQVQLHYQDQFGVGTLSDIFTVDVGALNRIHLTILGKPGALVGETFTPGTYPGNSGTPPVVTAGEQLVVEARLTDRYWNIVSGPAINGTGIQLDSLIPDSYIVSTHPDDPAVTFDISGELKFQNPPFDRSFRVAMRTAGGDRRFRATTSFSPASFLSSTVTVQAASYNRVALQVPGETLRPGSFFSNGKEGVPSTQGAGISFGMTAFLTDQFWNPVEAGPFANVRFQILPANANSFINGVTLGASNAMPSASKTFTVTLAEDSTVTLSDFANGAVVQAVPVPVGPGALDHFKMAFSAPGAKEAGVPYEVTIRAEDRFNQLITNYNNTITLEATTGVTTLSPESVQITNGLFTGDLTNFAAGTGIRVKMTRGSVVSFSDTFDVLPNSAGFQKLLILGPNETHRPGTPTGKTGVNAAHAVGTGVAFTAIACDAYFNKLNVSGNTINFTSNRYGVFSPANGTIATGDFATTFVMHAASTHVITATEPSLTLVATTSIVGLAGPYARVQILAPGQAPDPGNIANAGRNPAALPLTQKVSTPFTVTLRAVDNFYNLTNFNGGDTLVSANTPNAIVLPDNNAPGGLTPRSFVNGVTTRDVLVGEQGLWVIDGRDQNDLTKIGQTVEVDVQPGPTYAFTTPASATAGAPFSVTIRLQENGVPLAGYNQSIFLQAFLPAGGPATGSFNPDNSPREYVMSNGQVVINDLSYAFVEDVRIRLFDNFGRVTFSNTIQIVPSGLKYRVVVATQGIAGPPRTFPVSIELRELTTDTIVRNSSYNHTVGITAVSLLNPPAAGTLSITQAPLNQGVALLNLSYSKAEEIKLEVIDVNAAFGVTPAFSNSILLKADGYKKLVILAPGETHTPGLYQHATGKAGTPLSLDKSLSHVFQVRGVDQNWNVADEFSGGEIWYEANDGSTHATNPVNQGAPLVNGQGAAAIAFNTAGAITLTVRDTGNPGVFPQSVEVPVAGTFFDFPVLPASPNTCAPFTMNITLKDTTGNTIAANGPVQLEAIRADGTVAEGLLDVRTANLANGNVTIANQRYSIAEDIRIRVTGHDTTSISDVIRFVPRAVFYVYEALPAEANVNSAFNFTIRAMDQDCGTRVVNMTRSNLSLQAYSVATGLPVTGTFIPASVNIVNGVAQVSAIYDKAETIFLVLRDATTIFDPPPVPTQVQFNSPSAIKVNPGSLASVDVADFSLQSNEERTLVLVARDATNNPVPNQMLVFHVEAFDPSKRLSMNGSVNDYAARTDSNGQLSIEFGPLPESNGEITVSITDGDHPERGFSQLFRVDVFGLGRAPRRALGIGEDRIPVGSVVKLDLQNLSTNGGVMRTYWRMDGGTYQLYDPNVGITGFDQTKTYNVEWYSEVCYPSSDPTCSNPVRELSISGAPNTQFFSTYLVEDQLNGYPSPFNPKSGGINNFLTIQYPLAQASSVEVDIYDLFGQHVWHTDIPAGAEGGMAKTDNRVFWYGVNDDGTTVANGGYVVRVKIGATGQVLKTKVLVVK